MARYVICTVEDQEVEPGHWEPVIRPPALCATRGEAESELARLVREDREWSVFEVVDGRCLQRSVVFKDGSPEIQNARA